MLNTTAPCTLLSWQGHKRLNKPKGLHQEEESGGIDEREGGEKERNGRMRCDWYWDCRVGPRERREGKNESRSPN